MLSEFLKEIGAESHSLQLDKDGKIFRKTSESRVKITAEQAKHASDKFNLGDQTRHITIDTRYAAHHQKTFQILSNISKVCILIYA